MFVKGTHTLEQIYPGGAAKGEAGLLTGHGGVSQLCR